MANAYQYLQRISVTDKSEYSGSPQQRIACSRKSLEFENRGGARANVDNVKILSVDTVKRSVKGGFVAGAAWTVSGSVSHFGHTHCRQNRYHALVTFVMDDNVWKIRGIELIDEKRLL